MQSITSSDKGNMAKVIDEIRNLLTQSSPDMVMQSPIIFWIEMLEQSDREILFSMGEKAEKFIGAYMQSLMQLCDRNPPEGVQKGLLALLKYWSQAERESDQSSLNSDFFLCYGELADFSSELQLNSYSGASSSNQITSPIYELSSIVVEKQSLALSSARKLKNKSSSSNPTALQAYIDGMIEQLKTGLQDISFSAVRTNMNPTVRSDFDQLNFGKKDGFSTAYKALVESASKLNGSDAISEQIIKTLLEWRDDADLRFPTQLQTFMDILIQLLERIFPEDSSDLALDKLISLLPSAKQRLFEELNPSQSKNFCEEFNRIVARAGIVDLEFVRETLIGALKTWPVPNDGRQSAMHQLLSGMIQKILEITATDEHDFDFARVVKSLSQETSGLILVVGDSFEGLRDGYGFLCRQACTPRYPLKALLTIIDTLESLLPQADTHFPEIKSRAKPKKPLELQLKDVFYQICQYDAFADLLKGKLQRLDPVIQEAGCQWRVPFVLDLHQLVTTECKKISYCDLYLEKFDLVRMKGFNTLEWLKTFDCVRSLQSAVGKTRPKKAKITPPWTFEVTEEAWQQFILMNRGLIGSDKDMYKEISYWEEHGEEIDRLCAAYQVQSITEILSMIDLLKEKATGFIFMIELLKKQMGKWDLVIDPKKKVFNTLEYLTLCKGFTVNRIRRMDKFGLSGVRHDLKLPFGGAEAAMTISLAKYSRKYMTYIAQQVALLDTIKPSVDYKRISDVNVDLVSCTNVGTFQNSSAFTTHVFYGPLRTIFAYQSVKKQPIIIDIRRLSCTPTDELLYTKQKTGKNYNRASFSLNGAALLYFEPNEEGDFVFYPKPTKEQRNKVGMYVECFSIFRADKASQAQGELALVSPEKFDDYVNQIVTSKSIINWILCGASFHDEFPYPLCWKEKPKEKRLRLERKNDQDVVKADGLIEGLYLKAHNAHSVGQIPQGSLIDNPCKLLGITTDTTNLWRERFMFQQLVQQFGIDSVAYKDYADDRKTGYRNDEPVVFAPIHIYGCTYENKIHDLEEMIRKHQESDIVIGRLMDPKDEDDLNV